LIQPFLPIRRGINQSRVVLNGAEIAGLQRLTKEKAEFDSRKKSKKQTLLNVGESATDLPFHGASDLRWMG
jgi:hypothetical protein